MAEQGTGSVGLIWARSRNGVIGADGGIPWHLPEDLAHFRRTTEGTTVVMGRRTWESIPPRFRPFSDRRNVVLTRSVSWRAEGAETVHDLSAVLDLACRRDLSEVTGTSRTADGDPDAVTTPTPVTTWVIGGGAVYRDALPLADRVLETIVDVDAEGDTRAPELDCTWRLADEGPWQGSRTGLRYRILDWRR